jgi:hypothetical protein
MNLNWLCDSSRILGSHLRLYNWLRHILSYEMLTVLNCTCKNLKMIKLSYFLFAFYTILFVYFVSSIYMTFCSVVILGSYWPFLYSVSLQNRRSVTSKNNNRPKTSHKSIRQNKQTELYKTQTGNNSVLSF